MAFEYTTIDELRQSVERIAAQATEHMELREKLWPVLEESATEDRILLIESSNLVLLLSKEVATITLILTTFLHDDNPIVNQ